MDKPELADYGLKGIDSRPQIDVESMPITTEEYDAALKRVIEWEVGNVRVGKFRAGLREYEWSLVE